MARRARLRTQKRLANLEADAEHLRPRPDYSWEMDATQLGEVLGAMDIVVGRAELVAWLDRAGVELDLAT